MEAIPPLLTPAQPPKKSLGSRIADWLLGKLIILGLLLLVGYCVRAPSQNYPGKDAFHAANALIDSNSHGIAHGNTDEARKVATEFSQLTKSMQAMMFKGGSGFSIASGGEFVTYCQQTPRGLVVMVHVPELRNYQDAKTREALAKLTWSTANLTAKTLTFPVKQPTLVVGLRGLTSYGPVWSGKLGGEPSVKTDNNDPGQMYSYFVAPAAPAAPSTKSP